MKPIDISLEIPKGRMQFLVNGSTVREESNTITLEGIAAFSENQEIMNSAGGIFQHMILGTGRDIIQYEDTSIEGRITSLGVTSRHGTVIFRTINNKRYADINLFYTFNTATQAVRLGQVGLFRDTNNNGMLFGKTLDEFLPIKVGDNLTVIYSIRVNIISALAWLADSEINSVGFTAYGNFHVEGTDSLTIHWPYNTGGSVLTTGWATRLIRDDVVMDNGSARYQSQTTQTGLLTSKSIIYKILSVEAGNISFSKLECGNPTNTASGYSIRLMFDSAITKDVEHTMDIKFTVNIRWVSNE